jgi:DNA-binding response OmpR family regulator
MTTPWAEPLRALVVLDQPLIAETITLTLNHGRYRARTARTLPEASTLLRAWQPQLAVVDVDLGGPTLLAQLGLPAAAQGTRIPVLALTRRGDLKAKLAAFAQGVDDILTVPFAPEELLARTLVLTRRAYGEQHPLVPVLRLGELEIDILNRIVRAGDSVLHLTGLEQSLLYLLAANAGQVLSRDAILDALWGMDYVAESNVVDRHVRALRVKLQNDWRHPRFIATVPGRGYRFLPQFRAPDERS